MAEEQEPPSEVAVKWGDKSFAAKSKYLAEWIAMLSVGGTIALGAILYGHMLDARELKTELKETSTGLTKAMEKLAEATDRQTRAQREMNCLIALPQDKREAEYYSQNSFCKRLLRE